MTNVNLIKQLGKSDPVFSLKLSWLPVGYSSDEVCPNCLSRAKLSSRTIISWLKIGIPRSAPTYCGPSCRCLLVPNYTVKIGVDIFNDAKLFDPKYIKKTKMVNLVDYKYLDDKIVEYVKVVSKKYLGMKGDDLTKAKITAVIPNEVWNIAGTDNKIKMLDRIMQEVKSGTLTQKTRNMLANSGIEGV